MCVMIFEIIALLFLNINEILILQRWRKQKKIFQIIKDEDENGYYSFSSIVDNGDAIGSVIIISTDTPITDVEDKMGIILSRLLSTQFAD